MHSNVTSSRRADIKVEVANFCAAMDTLIDQDDPTPSRLCTAVSGVSHLQHLFQMVGMIYICTVHMVYQTQPGPDFLHPAECASNHYVSLPS